MKMIIGNSAQEAPINEQEKSTRVHSQWVLNICERNRLGRNGLGQLEATVQVQHRRGMLKSFLQLE